MKLIKSLWKNQIMLGFYFHVMIFFVNIINLVYMRVLFRSQVATAVQDKC